MRHWSHDPRMLCKTHLAAEHYELHMIASTLLKGYLAGLKGLAKTGKVAIHDVKRRHDRIEEEMIRRGMKPVAPFPNIENLLWVEGEVLAAESVVTLFVRCSDCRARIPVDVFKLCRRSLPQEIIDRIIRDDAARRVEGKSLVADLSLLEYTHEEVVPT